ncbi:MAG: hypothetical protein M1820_005318 [Bogoriella megaspora]|nr:MAG: hypothetical protein M1820_005318 [Bogoriella megaspora]
MATSFAPLRLLQAFINRFLPFTTPGTPLLQDVAHTVVLCTILYLGPSLQQYVQSHLSKTPPRLGPNPESNHGVRRLSESNNDHLRLLTPRGSERVVNGEDVALFEPTSDEELDDANDDNFLEEAQAPPIHANIQANNEPGLGDNGEGPANPAEQPRHRESSHRNVGAKKVKSLARREQRRAYHEFQRAQGDAQRAEEAKDAEEREAALFEEKRRRAVIDMEFEEKRKAEVEARKDREAKARDVEMRKREACVKVVRQRLASQNFIALKDAAKEAGYSQEDSQEWATRLVRGSGLLGTKRSAEGGALVTMITATGVVVKVEELDMKEAYSIALAELGTNGKTVIDYHELGRILEAIITP